ncbi:uncharacterized protein H6S33_001291 [Morchella sextelata]|uniref:uncharacterized protein n=1 Tax=Morchella sextelata TaxID=1174677 RepID=UPI001D04F63F|nr:uncharacterized protein H6S33_001291 [Morchella sextelata]KAH0609063.1 hypothetical protein H6S33_001291 [Morchella sextelata]
MRSDEAIFDEIIKDGSMDISEWPELLKRLLTRLEHIAHNSFPTPPPAPNPAAPSTIPASNPSTQSTAPDASDPSETPAEAPTGPPSNDTTDAPTAAATSTSPMAPPPPSDAPTTLPPTSGNTSPMSPDDLTTLTHLTTILTTSFDTAPPYTIQRLAELLRNPTAHYRSLTKYLRALTRVLSVSSAATVFPLEDTAAPAAPNGAAFMLGSDESLGGALLSPIPWLTPTALSDETAAVSQGELMRAEQELGIVAEGAAGEVAAPPPLGPEDVGPQPEGTVFEDPPGVEEMGRVEEMRDASVEREERGEESLEDKMQLDAAADGKEEEEARKEREKEKGGEKEGEGEGVKDEKMAEA